MKQIKPVLFIFVAIFIIILMVPSLLVAPFMQKTTGSLKEDLQREKVEEVSIDGLPVSVSVYRSQEKVIEEIPLEEYVVGVVASEMPAEFELEALKAQALAARTYIVKKLMTEKNVGTPDGSIVTDTQLHQVYKSKKELKKLWGADYDWKIQRITEAVAKTKGQILTYDNQPIDASFFSTSNGYTENAEAYWSNSLPYLKSVESPWDVNSPKFYDSEVFSIEEFENKLGVDIGNEGSVGKIIERTPGKRVAVVDINGKKLTGREVREKLELKSTDFAWERKGNQIIVKTKGYGHGIGMSQYGANFMAEEGKNYQDIVTYYYQGIEVSSADQFLTKYMAKQ